MMRRLTRHIIFWLFCAGTHTFAQNEYPVYFRGVTEDRVDAARMLERGDSLYYLQLYDSARYWYKKARLKSEYAAYAEGLVKADIAISNTYKQQGLYEAANSVLAQALLHCNTAGQTALYRSYIHNLIAINLGYRGRYEEAAAHYERALRSARLHPHPELSAEAILNNTASLHIEMGMREKALQDLKAIDSILSAKPNIRVKMNSLWTYSYLHEQEGNFRKAGLYLDTMTRLADSIGDETALYMGYWKLTDISILQHQTGDARHFLKKMREVAAGATDLEPVLRKRIHTAAGRIAEIAEDPGAALKEYTLALGIAREIKSPPEEADLHAAIARSYAAAGNYREAYGHETRAKILRDSVNKAQQARNVAEAESRYVTAQKDRELAEKNRAIAQHELYIYKQQHVIRNRNIIIGVTVVSICLIVVAFSFIIRNRQQKQKLKDEKMQLALREQELKQIRSMMDAEEQERTRIARDIHDGLMIRFSTVMMNLSALFHGDRSKEPYLEQLDKAIGSLRNVAHNLMPDVLLEGGLTEAIYYFCENLKEEISFELTLNLLNDVPRFDEKLELSVYRIVQELIQNIVKHAQAGEAYIQIGYSEGTLLITIEDDGIGMDASLAQTKGLGLKSIQNRIVALNGSMEITSEQHAGTSIVLELCIHEAAVSRKNSPQGTDPAGTQTENRQS